MYFNRFTVTYYFKIFLAGGDGRQPSDDVTKKKISGKTIYNA